MSQNNELKTILAYLLGEAVTQADVEAAVTRIASQPKLQARFEQLAEVLTHADDPAWLEEVAAAAEGIITPGVVDFLADQTALAAFDPAPANQLEAALSGSLLPELPDENLLPPLPVQEAESEADESWLRREGFEWRLHQAGVLAIRLLAVTATLVAPLSPTALKGVEADAPTETVLRRCVLEPDDTGDLAVEVIISQPNDEPNVCRLTVRAESQARWPDLGGIVVQAGAVNWQAEGITDDTGEVVFEGLPQNLVSQLNIQIKPG